MQSIRMTTARTPSSRFSPVANGPYFIEHNILIPMQYNGLFFGLTAVDIIHYVPRFPKANEKLKSERQLTYAGGPAANAAVTFCALGNAATLVTDIGKLFGGQFAREELAGWGVEVIDCTDQPDRPPVTASILVDLSNGNRMVVYSNTDVRKIKREILNETLLDNKDILLLDGHYPEQAARVAQRAREVGIPTVLDGGSWKEGEEALLPSIDYAICSADFRPPGCEDSNSVISYLQEYGIRNLAITRGADSVVAVKDGDRRELPVLDIKPIDTLGAGDIFHGAFCHFILHHDFLTSLARASEIATLSCTSLGTRRWIEQEKFI